MTKFNWNIQPIPGFSCVKMKQDIQAKIYEETKDMTPEQRRERTYHASKRFREEGKRFQITEDKRTSHQR
jgi:hypothetical protein